MKYNSQIIWDYSISQKNVVKISKNSTSKSFLSKKNNTKNIRNENSYTSKKTRFNIYYAILFLSLFGFVFLLGINIVHASVISPGDSSVNYIEDSGEALAILRNYALKSDKKQEVSESKTFSLPEKLVFYNYRVKKNDSFDKIAHKFGIKLDTIYLTNNIIRKRVLKVGEVLKIPNQNGRLVKVTRNDSISKIANRFGVSWETIVDVNGLTSSTIHPGERLFVAGSQMSKYERKLFYNDVKKFIWPLNGVIKITSPFGPRRDPITGAASFHNGIDIKSSKNSPVKVARDGKVVFIGWSNIYGNYMLVKHKGGYITGYAHLNKTLAKKNQWVKQGDVIAKSGNTGRSTGPHLHFEVRKNGKAINPLLVLK